MVITEQFNPDVNELIIKYRYKLKIIQIRKLSFKNTKAFVVQDCPRLESIYVDEQCFLVEEPNSFFVVKDCPVLTTIIVGNFSFNLYNYFEVSGNF